MKIGARLLSVLLLVSLIALGLVSTVAGQGDDLTCNGLDPADCEILMDAQQATSRVYAARVPSWSLAFDVVGVDDPGRLTVSGSAAFSLSDEVAAVLSDLPTGPTVDMTSYLTLLDTLDAAWIEGLLNDTLAYVALDELSLDAQSEDFELRGFEAALKDGTAYVYLTAPNGAAQWFGEPVALSAEDRAEIDAALEEMRANLATALDDPAFAESMAEFEAWMQVYEPLIAVVGQHVTVTRLADAVVDGQPVAVFESVFDLNSLLQDPALATAIVELLQDPALAEMMAGDEDAAAEMGQVTEAQVQFILMTFGLLLNDTTIRSETWVGLEDGYIHHTAAEMVLNVDPSLFGTDEAGEPVEAIRVAVSFSMDLADFNAVTPDMVEVPDDYLPLEQIDEFLPGGPSQIVDELAPGETISATSAESGDQIYALALEAGDAVTLALDSDAFLSLEVYGPDGFRVDAAGDGQGDALTFTAGEAGTYLVVVNSYWAADYDLSVEVE